MAARVNSSCAPRGTRSRTRRAAQLTGQMSATPRHVAHGCTEARTYSTTSSARASRVGEIVMPSALAVFRLTTKLDSAPQQHGVPNQRFARGSRAPYPRHRGGDISSAISIVISIRALLGCCEARRRCPHIAHMRAKPMRALFIVCSTSLLLASGTAADAASGGRAPRDPSQIPSQQAPDEISKFSVQYLEQCINDWEPATHMTKQEGRRTCERVARDRVRFLIEQAKNSSKK